MPTSNLLTSKEVQELLKIDRITVYRMLKDGRLSGVKIGQQWRFPQHEVDVLLSGASDGGRNTPAVSTQVLPVHCIQPIQEVFAQIAEVGSLTTAPDGEPLTMISNSCRFCDLILASESGRRACIASWRKLAEQPERQPKFVTCHAGLQYARARIELDGELIAMIIAGQFYDERPSADDERARVDRLADALGIEHNALGEAASELRKLDERKRAQIGQWLEKVAQTFEQVSRERAEFMKRLQDIAAMSTLEPNV